MALSRASALQVHHTRPILVQGRVVGVLLLSRSARALFRGLYEDRGKILIGVAVILACLIFLSGLISRGVARPIEALSRAAREVAAGHGDIPETPATAAVEIRDLYEDFRVMAEAITRRSRYLRDFAGAVSHEFKTPLAGITGAVELLQDHYEEMSEAERRRFPGRQHLGRHDAPIAVGHPPASTWPGPTWPDQRQGWRWTWPRRSDASPTLTAAATSPSTSSCPGTCPRSPLRPRPSRLC